MENGVMLSIRPEWIRMIFNKDKFMEFRNKIILTIKPETKIFLYETKFNGGLGKVVGEAIISKVEVVDHSKKDLYLQCWSYIGYTNQKYSIYFTAVKKYINPLELNEFEYMTGNPVIYPPQNMFNVRRKLHETII